MYMAMGMGVAVLIVNIMCFVFFIMVLVKLFKNEGALKGILGFFCQCLKRKFFTLNSERRNEQ